MSHVGDQSVALRTYVVVGRDPRTGADRKERRDERVDGCLVTPSNASEPDDPSAAPRISGLQLLTPLGVDIDAAEAIVYPITGETVVDGRTEYQGPEYQVTGDVGIWEDVQQARLVKAGGAL